MDIKRRDLPTSSESDASNLSRMRGRLRGIDHLPDESPVEKTDMEERFTALGESAWDLICELNSDLQFAYLSPNYRQLLHYKPAGLIGEKILEFVHPEDVLAVAEQLDKLMIAGGSSRLLFRFRNAEGEWRWLDSSGKAYCTASGSARAVFISRDATEGQHLEEQRALLASRDPMTLLYNKQYFVEQLIQAVQAAERGEFSAVIYMDLDNFKLINDCCGHLAGDRLIVSMANLLHEATPEGGLLARFGGDEFLLLLKGSGGLENAGAVAEDVRSRLAGYHFINGGNAYAVSASLGIVEVDGAINSREVLNRVNAACASAKAMGGNRVEMFRRGGMGRDGFREAARWSERIMDGLSNGSFELWYQPVIHTGTREVDHHEALIRLRERGGTVCSPSVFLPSAERFGYMEIVDRYVVERAIEYLARNPERRVAVILSGYSFTKPDMTTLILDMLKQTNVAPDSLIVQIPWVALLATITTVRKMFLQLKEARVQLGIKNFQADSSSVQYLRDFPVDYLKLDGEIMRDFISSSLNQATVSALNEIGHALNAHTIAEFVDDQATLDRLREIGIDYAKGDFLGMPQPEIRES